MASQSDIRAVVRRALQCPHGWEMGAHSSTGHAVMRLPSGARVQVPTSASDVNSARNLATQLADACGCDTFWARAGSGRRSRKPNQFTDFNPTLAANQQERWREAHPERAELPKRYARLESELISLDPRRNQSRCLEIAEALVALASDMDARHIYFERKIA